MPLSPAILALAAALAPTFRGAPPPPAFTVLARPAAAVAQIGRDPLTSSEADRMRDAAGDPDKRVDLLLQFAAHRLADFQSVRAANAPDRSSEMYRLLREYQDIVGELDDNLGEMMSGHTTSEMAAKPKPRKSLEKVVVAETGFLSRLRQIQKSSSAADLATYRFQLTDSLDATQLSQQRVSQDLADLKRQQAEKKHKKKAATQWPLSLRSGPAAHA